MATRMMPMVFATLLVACGPTLKDAARTASKTAVRESVDELTSERAKSNLAAAATDPRVESATHELTDQVTEGILRSLESPRAHAQIAALTRTAVEAATKQLLATLSSKTGQVQVQTLSGVVADSVWLQTATSLKMARPRAAQSCSKLSTASMMARACAAPSSRTASMTACSCLSSDVRRRPWGATAGVAPFAVPFDARSLSFIPSFS